MMVGQGSSFTIRQHPFTETQLKELELQTLIFNYLASGIPIPPHLIAHLRRSFYFLDQYPSSKSQKFSPSSLLCFSILKNGFFLVLVVSLGRRAEEDPEPWRCKRTDGKKWRCLKEAFQDSKNCERHMHRGKKSSRKLVELPSHHSSSNTYLFLGSPSCMMPAQDNKSHRSECYNFFSEERESSVWFRAKQSTSQFKKEEEQRQQHCYVLGADLMSQKPAVKMGREPKPLLCLFNECVETSK